MTWVITKVYSTSPFQIRAHQPIYERELSKRLDYYGKSWSFIITDGFSHPAKATTVGGKKV
jgi:hypothetical protein